MRKLHLYLLSFLLIPDPLDRYQKVGELTKEWQAKDATTNNYETNRNSYLKMIDGLIYGEDPRQGYVENSYFYHPELKVSISCPTWMAGTKQPSTSIHGT